MPRWSRLLLLAVAALAVAQWWTGRESPSPTGATVPLETPAPRPDAGQRYDAQAAGLPESARKPGGGVKLKGIPADKLARKILLYCERRKPELVMPAKARILFALAQLSPALGDWIIGRMTSS